MQTVIQSQLAITGALSSHRRRIAAISPKAFAQVYLAKHMRLKPSRMHEDLYGMLGGISSQRGQRIAVAAPRGHAKSTVVSLAYILWSILYKHEQLVLIISGTKEQAALLLKNLKDEIQGNELLLEDFPDVCSKPGEIGGAGMGGGRMPKPWRDNCILLRNGVMIRVLGSGQALRGVRHGPYRPSLIICDDLENQEHCESAEQRIKLRDWFEKTLLKAGDARTNVVVVGTVAKNLNDDSLYVLHADIARRKPEETINRIVQLAKVFNYRDFVVEGNQFQTVMVESLRQRAVAAGVSLHPRSMNSTANKQARIEGLEAYISSGRLKFSRCQTMLLEQLRQFPLGAHDDGPDALEMCISWCAERRVVTGGRVYGMW